MTQARDTLSQALGVTGGHAASWAHFQALVDSSDDAILSKDPNGVITSWNAAAERLYGYTAGEAVGQRINLIIPEERADEEGEILGKVMAGEPLKHYETDRVRKDGRHVPVSLTISPICDEHDEIVGASVVARDISERVLARKRAERLQEVTTALAREAEPENAIKVLLSAGHEILGADAASLGLVDESGEHVELVDAFGHSEQGLADWRSFPLDAELPMCVAIRDLVTVWSPSPEDLAERFPPLGGSEIDFSALAVLPLAVEKKRIGAVSFSFERPKQFGAEERAFMGSIVQQAAYNLERARIFDVEHRARQRLTFLAVASQALSQSLDARTTLRQLAELSVQHLADWCSADLVSEDGELESVGIVHVDRSKSELARRYRSAYPPDPGSEEGVAHVVRTGKPKLFPRLTDEELSQGARSEEHLEMLRGLGLVSAMVVPVAGRGGTLGALTFAVSDPSRAFDADDLELAADLGRRAGQTLEALNLYRREHETALTLQRAMLPGELPRVEGLEVAARYLPADAGLEVGGDWYDVIETHNDQVHLMIGDVAGRGLKAAAVMGRLAITARAHALADRPVQEVIGGINEVLIDSESDAIATVFDLSLNPATGAATYVRAGHPPALVRRADGRIVELGEAGSPPIGWRSDLVVSAAACRLEPGSTVLLFTDGLVERRGYVIDTGIELLRQAFANAPDDPGDIVEFIPAELGAERVNDDIALIAAKLTR